MRKVLLIFHLLEFQEWQLSDTHLAIYTSKLAHVFISFIHFKVKPDHILLKGPKISTGNAVH